MWKEFKEFALRGNVIDLAVGIIIGGAFGKVVSSLVNDIIMPPIGLILGKINFSDLFLDLSGTNPPSLSAAREAGVPVLAYGSFIQSLVDFLIVAFAIFLLIRAVNRLRALKPEPATPPAQPTTRECPYCFSTIPIKATRCPHCTSQL
ncbi:MULTISPECIES: large conductance mechanosensitive channel protein MscL [Anaerolinea]|jgi:large conductance mechanosensitive channel|uniref:large conductance mechanosensitive channel protein MscL n=1 Tax=Anaerolinea TaxID=233189 RepID=UPI00260AB078|nr:large conductance mechanosensitive channel protein MscL [Anaerolinea thermophila]